MADDIWINEQEIGYDYLKPNSFRMTINALPKVSFYCQSVSLPGFSMDPAMLPTPFHDLPIAGDKGTYSPLRITFLVDAQLANFLELRTWLLGLAFPDSNQQYINLQQQGTNKPLSLAPYPQLNSGEYGLYSDATVMILTGKGNPYAKIMYKDLFPISISDMEFATTINDITYTVATAEFQFKTFIVDITGVTVPETLSTEILNYP